MTEQLLYLWCNYPPPKEFQHYIKDSITVNNRVALGTRRLFRPPNADDVVLCFGDPVLKVLQANKIAHGGRTVGSLRHTVMPGVDDHGQYMVTQDLYLCNFLADNGEKTAWDCMLADRYVRTQSLEPTLGKYRYVKTFDTACRYVAKRWKETGRPTTVAMDLETLSTDPYNPDAWIISIALTYHEGYSDVMYFKKGERPRGEVYAQIRALLRTRKVQLVGANLKFDVTWLAEKWRMDVTNFMFDSLLVGSLLDANRSNSLEVHSQKYTPELAGYDSVITKKEKARMDLVKRGPFLRYAGGDTHASHIIARRMGKELSQDKKLARFYKHVLHPGAEAVQEMERVGIVIDVPYFKKISKEIQVKKDQILEEMLEMVPGAIVDKFKGKKNLPVNRAVLQELFFTRQGFDLTPKMLTKKKKEPSTSKDHFEQFFNDDDPTIQKYVELLVEWNSADKTKSTFVDGFLKHARHDGRLHPNYFLFAGNDDKDLGGGTGTGRASTKEPAIHIRPKHTVWAPILREGYPAPPGHCILSADYSQGELKITADVAGVNRFIKAYKKGIDMHAVTGSSVSGMSLKQFYQRAVEDQKVIRQKAKAVNFGLIYKMSPEGLVTYAWFSYGVRLTLEEAELICETFLYRDYPEIPEYFERQIALVHKFKRVVSKLGRIRHLPLIDSPDREVVAQQERRAINAPTQGTLSDICLYAIAELRRKYPWLLPFEWTHDNIDCYCPVDRKAEGAAALRDAMEGVPLEETFGWRPVVPFTVDVECGPHLNALEKIAA